jgi:hypothetical protein
MYDYTRNDILRYPNKYAYTPYLGNDFIAAWLQNRQRLIEQSELPVACGSVFEHCSSSPTGRELKQIFETLSRGEKHELQLLEEVYRFVKRFEITRRIHAEYDQRMKPVDRMSYQHIELYLAFSVVVSKAYALFGQLQLLNAILKCNDIIVSLQESLEEPLMNIGSELMKQEQRFVLGLIEP